MDGAWSETPAINRDRTVELWVGSLRRSHQAVAVGYTVLPQMMRVAHALPHTPAGLRAPDVSPADPGGWFPLRSRDACTISANCQPPFAAFLPETVPPFAAVWQDITCLHYAAKAGIRRGGRRGGRVVEGTPLLRAQTSKASRGFESHPLRQPSSWGYVSD